MRLCDKKDAIWLAALMLNTSVFEGCSEDGVSKKQMVGYVKNMLQAPDITILAPVPGRMVHTFVRKNGVMYEIHTAFHPELECSGKERVVLTRAACRWMIQHRGARKFITQVPKGNRAAGLYAVACGLERGCVLTKAMRKGGELIDVALFQSRDNDIERERRIVCQH